MLVILGGHSQEKDIIFNVMSEIIETAEEIGVKCQTFYFQNNVTELLDYIDEFQPDVVSNAVLGEDGMNGLMDLLRIPYIGEKVFGNVTTNRKYLTKLMLKDAGHNVPNGFLMRKKYPWQEITEKMKRKGISFPVIIKPNNMGSKMGISYVRSECEVRRAFENAFQYDKVVW